MIEQLLTNGKNKVIGIDEGGYYVATLVGDILTKKHHITKEQFKEMVSRWIK